jgi:hypothetical protein
MKQHHCSALATLQCIDCNSPFNASGEKKKKLFSAACRSKQARSLGSEDEEEKKNLFYRPLFHHPLFHHTKTGMKGEFESFYIITDLRLVPFVIKLISSTV